MFWQRSGLKDENYEMHRGFSLGSFAMQKYAETCWRRILEDSVVMVI
jgi:hypothetical protein